MYEQAVKGFSRSEYLDRIRSISDYLIRTGKDGYLVQNPYNICYLGHYYLAGKRPVIFYVHKSGQVCGFVPAMEYESASQLSWLDRLAAYDDDYSAKGDLFRLIEKTLKADFGEISDLIVDTIQDLNQLSTLEASFSSVTVQDEIAVIRQIKTTEEIAMLRISAAYSDYMVASCRRHLKPGATEIGILNRAITDTVDKMCSDGIPVIYVEGGPAGALLPSGPNTSKPHALPSQRVVLPGDNLLFSCGANVWGYRTESERTVFYGEPAKAFIEPFEVMREAQLLGISLMVPGAVCSEVEKKVFDFIDKAGYAKMVRHRTGHGKGLEEHEAPYIAAGDDTVIQPGMIFSSEPGIYIDGLAGFRHSDIVLVTEQGGEPLTHYPKTLDELIIPVTESHQEDEG